MTVPGTHARPALLLPELLFIIIQMRFYCVSRFSLNRPLAQSWCGDSESVELEGTR